jgi:CO dehydrogenase/acetyl-CoA synthase delta subunit
MSKQEILTKEIVKYLMDNYKELLKDVVLESIESKTIPDIKLIQEEGHLYLDITYKEIKCTN